MQIENIIEHQHQVYCNSIEAGRNKESVVIPNIRPW